MKRHTTPSRSKTYDVLPLPLLIDTPAALTELQRMLEGISRLAIDTESNSLYAYQAHVCLIQLSTDSQDFLVDPLSLPADQLAFLGEICANPAVEKVFHAAEYDVMTLRRDFGFSFANLFDTMIAARVLGWEQVGLGSILSQRYGVTVNKRHQRANWGLRPLSPALIRYAQIDTHYLLPLRDALHDLLEAGKHLEEAREMFDEVCHAQWNGMDFDPEAFWRIAGARDLDPRMASILRELYLFREEQAQQRNLPVFKVLADDTLIALATARPHSLHQMQQIPGMTEILIRRYGVGILKAVQRGLKADSPLPPRQNGSSHNEVVTRRFEALHTWRKERAAQRGVSSEVVMSRDALWQLAIAAPRTLEQIERLHCLGPWRVKTYGEEVIEVLAKVDHVS